MGFIADMAEKAVAVDSGPLRSSPTDRGQGLRLWREIFGATDKEEGRPTVQTDRFVRSTVGTAASYKRLLQAMRSMAPGGWSDDRWEQTRHFVGIQYVAIHRCCEMLAQAEFQVYVRDPEHPEGKRPVTENDPPQGDRHVQPYELVQVLSKPNKDDSFGDLMYRWNQQLDLTGMSLTWMVPNKLGCPYELYSIPTAVAIPQPAINPDYPDGFYRIQPIYPYGPFSSYPTPASAVGAPIPAQWMLRFLYPHPLLRYEGYSPQSALRLHLDEIEAMDRSRFYSMKRGINPSAVLNMDEMEGAEPLPEPEIERIRAEFENEQMGPENTGKLFVATPGAKLEPWGARPVDMDYQAGWEQLVGFALGGFGITKPAAGMVDDSSYSTLFATLKQLYWLTLEPKVNRFAGKLTRHLAPYFGDNLIVEIRCRRIDDHDVRNAKVDKLIQGKAITKNELRQEMDLPPTPEPWGDEIAGEGGEEQQQPGMPGMPPAPAAPGTPGPEEGVAREEEKPEPPEVTATRPSPGNLSTGALGPRMKSFYQLAREVMVNGHK